jgi:hypothetical protein
VLLHVISNVLKKRRQCKKQCKKRDVPPASKNRAAQVLEKVAACVDIKQGGN